MKTAATHDRNFRTFLLVSQLEAKAIGARIALARNEAGMTQEEVADVATFSKRSLQDYEAGVTIPYKHLREIGKILKREVPWFLHGEPEQPEGAVSLQEILRRLAALEDLVAELPTAEDLKRGLETLRKAIDAQATRGTRRAPKATTG